MQLRALALACGVSLAVSAPIGALADEASYVEQPDSAEAATLTYMREEEKLARDVYRRMYALWGANVFNNIAQSEQRHTDAVEEMLDKYRLPDPTQQDIPGVFVNPKLQALYDQLVARGEKSLMKALHVGAFIEEADMNDLSDAIDQADGEDLDRLYENLMQGSRNHLRAFVRQIEFKGTPYEAQVLSQEEVDAIVDSPMERGTVR